MEIVHHVLVHWTILPFSGSSACEGDSGGGLVFPSRDNRYYIRGIVSVAPKGPFESCDADEYTLYTKVSKHIDFISEIDSIAKAS